ncbi:MAG: type II toxin-antitoxin system RelE/ParE family toxin [Epsilonproteobacteria bacterium]|nr:MAG: type II toxin-antitoxin system RelE/ParE family toxin [Campylobacterota bacterium]
MEIIRADFFKAQLRDISFHIAKDKVGASKLFRKELNLSIDNLVNFPYKFRPSYYYEDENIRDMIFNGYSIIYRVNQEKDVIEILEIFNRNLPRLDSGK